MCVCIYVLARIKCTFAYAFALPKQVPEVTFCVGTIRPVLLSLACLSFFFARFYPFFEHYRKICLEKSVSVLVQVLTRSSIGTRRYSLSIYIIYIYIYIICIYQYIFLVIN